MKSGSVYTLFAEDLKNKECLTYIRNYASVPVAKSRCFVRNQLKIFQVIHALWLPLDVREEIRDFPHKVIHDFLLSSKTRQISKIMIIIILCLVARLNR